MTADTDTMPALPEPAMEDVPYELWGQNAIHPALYTADQLNDYGRQCAEQARTKAQPTTAQIEALAHRMCSRYQAPRVYTFNGTTLLEFAQALLRNNNILAKE